MLNDRATEILEEQKTILEKKGQDYQNVDSMVTDEDYFKYDKIPGMQMMYTKLMRYVSVMESDNVNFEAADDSLRDLINYAARTIAYNESQNGVMVDDLTFYRNWPRGYVTNDGVAFDSMQDAMKEAGFTDDDIEKSVGG